MVAGAHHIVLESVVIVQAGLELGSAGAACCGAAGRTLDDLGLLHGDRGGGYLFSLYFAAGFHELEFAGGAQHVGCCFYYIFAVAELQPSYHEPLRVLDSQFSACILQQTQLGNEIDGIPVRLATGAQILHDLPPECLTRLCRLFHRFLLSLFRRFLFRFASRLGRAGCNMPCLPHPRKFFLRGRCILASRMRCSMRVPQ